LGPGKAMALCQRSVTLSIGLPALDSSEVPQTPVSRYHGRLLNYPSI